MKSYATVNDIIKTGKNLTPAQTETAEILIETASSKLRLIASRYGKNIDKMIDALNSFSDTPPVTQESQSALGYTASMTYLNAGQSLYFLRNELKELGILRQQFGALEVFGNYDKRNDD